MIKITDITPFMKDGWVAMNGDKRWCWHKEKPVAYKKHDMNFWYDKGYIVHLDCFNIAPAADDWTHSLIKIDNRTREKFEKEYQNNIQRTIQELNK